MHFLTWHGTVLLRNRAHGRLIHARPVPAPVSADDWHLDMGSAGVATENGAQGAHYDIVPVARDPGAFAIQGGGGFLCADPVTGQADFDRQAIGIWETLLPLSLEQLARLRHLLCVEWAEGDAGKVGQAMLLAGFKLRIGTCEMDLRRGIPGELSAPEILTDPVSGRQFHAAAVVTALHVGQCNLRRRPPEQQVLLVTDQAAFAATPNSRVNIAGDTEYGFLPLAASRADQDWMQARWSQFGSRHLGPQKLACQAVREQDKYVLLTRGQEGILFDKAGASNETGYLISSIRADSGGIIRREWNDFYVSRDAMQQAPHLAGPHVVFYGGNLSNYYHWLIDALLPLHVLRPYLPPNATLLIPPSLQGFRDGLSAGPSKPVDHMAALHAWGFGDLPIVEPRASICHVEEVYWLDQCFIAQMPARLLRAARDAVLAQLPPAEHAPAGPKRIFIRRRHSRRIANIKMIENVAAKNGFEFYELENMSPSAQIDLFRGAEFVMAVHGAALANLIFCQPGTKVIELSPDSEFRPFFAQISDKIGLVHGVLPCPTHDGGFNGRLAVDPDKLRMLMNQMRFMVQAA